MSEVELFVFHTNLQTWSSYKWA